MIVAILGLSLYSGFAIFFFGADDLLMVILEKYCINTKGIPLK